MFHRSRLVANVVQIWRSLKFIKRERSQLARLKLSLIMPVFERVKSVRAVRDAFKQMKRLTLSESAWDLFRLNLLKRCWHEGLVINAKNSKRKKAVQNDIKDLYQTKLRARALASLKNYKIYQQSQKVLKNLAQLFYKEHGAVDSKKKVYDSLVSFAIYAKQAKNAREHYRYTLLFKAMVSLCDYQQV